MIVLKFGVRAILSGHDAMRDEMHTAHHLFNALVAIERWKRRGYAAVRSRYVPGLSEVETAYEQLSEWIGEHAGPSGERGKIREKRRQASAPKPGGKPHPTKRVDDDPERDAIAELKSWRSEASVLAKPLREEFKALVQAADEEYRRRTSLAPERDNHAKKRLNASVREAMLAEPEWHEAWKDVARVEATAYELRSWVGDAHNLNHGTYTAVADDLVRAGKRPPPRPDGEPRKPKQRPAFSRRGLRKMGWQIQGGVAWSDVLAGKCRDLRVSDMRTAGRSGHRWRATFAIRISTPDRESTWVTVDTIVHRPIPSDTQITWIYLVPEVHRDRRVDYSVQLTAQPTKPLIQRIPGREHAHIEFCWTKSADTLCVARINGEPLCLPARIPERIRYADHIRSEADKLFNETREIALAHGLGYYRSPDRLGRAILERDKATAGALERWHEWRDERLAGKCDLFAPLDEVRPWALARNLDPVAFWLTLWRHKNKHLRQMEQGNRDHATRGRTDYYRVTAATLSQAFETVSYGGAVNVAALALRDKAENRPPKELHEAARRNRVVAAVGELRECITYALGRERLRDAPVPGSARSSTRDAGSSASDAAAE